MMFIIAPLSLCKHPIRRRQRLAEALYLLIIPDINSVSVSGGSSAPRPAPGNLVPPGRWFSGPPRSGVTRLFVLSLSTVSSRWIQVVARVRGPFPLWLSDAALCAGTTFV